MGDKGDVMMVGASGDGRLRPRMPREPAIGLVTGDEAAEVKPFVVDAGDPFTPAPAAGAVELALLAAVKLSLVRSGSSSDFLRPPAAPVPPVDAATPDDLTVDPRRLSPVEALWPPESCCCWR